MVSSKKEQKGLGKKERKRLIERISKASGVAMYAIEKKMTDAQVIKLSNSLDLLHSLKSSIDYNRYCQKQKTATANKSCKAAEEKLKGFLDSGNSEVINAGKWLVNALSKKGSERKNRLKEKRLVHADDYNDATTDLKETISEVYKKEKKVKEEAESIIEDLEDRVDVLRKQLSSLQDAHIERYGVNSWNALRDQIGLIEDTDQGAG